MWSPSALSCGFRKCSLRFLEESLRGHVVLICKETFGCTPPAKGLSCRSLHQIKEGSCEQMVQSVKWAVSKIYGLVAKASPPSFRPWQRTGDQMWRHGEAWVSSLTFAFFGWGVCPACWGPRRRWETLFHRYPYSPRSTGRPLWLVFWNPGAFSFSLIFPLGFLGAYFKSGLRSHAV